MKGRTGTIIATGERVAVVAESGTMPGFVELVLSDNSVELWPADDEGIDWDKAVPTAADKAAERKARPVFTGVIAYFPDALKAVAHVSKLGNDQHNPGQPLHWARGKSTDQLDAAIRHMIDHLSNPVDDDGGLHLAKAAWRVLAELQLSIERQSKK